MKKIVFILLGIAMVFHCKAQAQKIIIRGGGNVIYKFDDFSRSEKVIYQLKKSGTSGSQLHVSPGAKYISLIETEAGTYNRNKRESSYDQPPRNTLVILNPNGNVVMRLDEDVREYVWNPDGNKVAYITGTYLEGGEPVSFATTGFYILNMQTKEKIKIDHSARPYKLLWLRAKEQNCIYIKTLTREYKTRIMRYNIDKKQLEISNLNDIHLSPDGNYCAMFSSENEVSDDFCVGNKTNNRGYGCVKIYKSKSNQIVGDFSSEKYGIPQSWVYNKGHLFMFHTIGRNSNGLIISEYFVYDIETSKLVQKFTGKVIPQIDYDRSPLTYNDYIVVDKTGGEAPKPEYIIHKIPKEYINSNEK